MARSSRQLVRCGQCMYFHVGRWSFVCALLHIPVYSRGDGCTFGTEDVSDGEDERAEGWT